MASLEVTDVYLGHWINWSYGVVQGSTITMSKRDGAILTAAIAIFLTFAGARFWRIIAFMICLFLAKDSPQDGVYHQRQAILRNSSSAFASAWNFSLIVWAWRDKHCHAWRRVIPFIATALLTGLALSAASVLSGQISSSMGNEVLLSGKHCGALDMESNSDEAAFTAMAYFSQLEEAALQRAEQCYPPGTFTESCSTFIKPSFPLSKIRNASCPFEPSICQSDSSNLVIDTGYLNSHFDLGFNAPPSERILFRHRMHCAPLVLDGYIKLVNVTESSNASFGQNGPNVNMEYYYGQNTAPMSFRNWTYQYPYNQNNAYFPSDASAYGGDYTLGVNTAYSNNTLNNSGFVAIPELSRKDADTMLLFLSANNIGYPSPVDDLWYSAHRGPYSWLENSTLWFADNSASVLGCALQVQLCNPNLSLDNGCGPLLSLSELSENWNGTDQSMWQSEKQANFAYTFVSDSSTQSPYRVQSLVAGRGAAVLESRKTLLRGIQSNIADNQWQLDMENLVAIYLAGMQMQGIEYASGIRYPGLEQYAAIPSDEWADVYCRNQVILSNGYTSFSTLTLCLALGSGGFLIVVSFFLEPLLCWARRKFRWNSFPLLEWSLNETLQLQSLVHEELGLGSWTREIGKTPVTERQERLGVLDLSEPGHLKYSMPRKTFGVPDMVDMEGSGHKAIKGMGTASEYPLID
ncbi:hypothetical protein K432DRAFT_394700 [Lepidopterella palustris CBS 459.81]|uniref:Uncharacterized protein n=1 Tax=Lepidopterella palustris CBS 459.81 TaxID=1314670 RepID=A0A8E2E6Z5_9PEZI|nr:hypothetical protein K432DRAFT_394700 [Lepidopterella palustris CBS 459.81]